MELYINGSKVDASIENEKTVGDVLTSFAQECENSNAAVVSIKVDDKQITAEMFDETAKEPLTENSKFEFDIVNQAAVSEAAKDFSKVLDCLSSEIEQVPSLFMNGKGQEANDSIKKLADAIDQFCHIAALASLFPNKFNASKIGDKNFAEFFNDFSPVLSDFENALASNDTVLTGDLCEYEICPRLKEMSQCLADFAG